MREILFRGKRIDNGEWVEGFYGRYQNDDSSYTHIIKEDTTLHIANVTITSFQVIPETIGQFTGLCDKNGNRIFEGDVFLSFIYNNHHIVEWSDMFGGWIAKHTDNVGKGHLQGDCQLWVYVRDNEFEVIGNIHDNPELLTNN